MIIINHPLYLIPKLILCNGNKLNINNINNSNNLINMSFGNNNNINGNNSQSPFIFFNNNKDLNNFGNKTQDNNDENYF